MKRLLLIALWQCRFHVGAALVLLCAAAAAQACPPMPARSQLKAMRMEGLRLLALQRWLKCGWEASGPAMRLWRTAATKDWIKMQREEGPFLDGSEALASNDFAGHLYILAQLNPAEIDDVLQELSQELELEDADALADLLRLDVEEGSRAARYEAGVPPAVAILQKNFATDPAVTLDLELMRRLRAGIEAGRLETVLRDYLPQDSGGEPAESSQVSVA